VCVCVCVTLGCVEAGTHDVCFSDDSLLIDPKEPSGLSHLSAEMFINLDAWFPG